MYLASDGHPLLFQLQSRSIRRSLESRTEQNVERASVPAQSCLHLGKVEITRRLFKYLRENSKSISAFIILVFFALLLLLHVFIDPLLCDAKRLQERKEIAKRVVLFSSVVIVENGKHDLVELARKLCVAEHHVLPQLGLAQRRVLERAAT